MFLFFIWGYQSKGALYKIFVCNLIYERTNTTLTGGFKQYGYFCRFPSCFDRKTLCHDGEYCWNFLVQILLLPLSIFDIVSTLPSCEQECWRERYYYAAAHKLLARSFSGSIALTMFQIYWMVLFKKNECTVSTRHMWRKEVSSGCCFSFLQPGRNPSECDDHMN